MPGPVPVPSRARRADRISEAQAGNALIVVIIVVTITTLLSSWAMEEALHSQSGALHTTKQVDSTASADAGLNSAIRSIGSSPPASLPCGTGALSVTLGTAPVTSSYSVWVGYYSTYPHSGSKLSCADVHAGSAVPAAALVSSTGSTATAAYGDQEMQDLLCS